MGTRFGRRAADGTTEYYDSRQQLDAAEIREQQEGLTNAFGLIGLLIGGCLSYALTYMLAGALWLKIFRFSAVILGAGLTSYVLARFANVITTAFAYVVAIAIFFGIASLIWHFL